MAKDQKNKQGQGDGDNPDTDAPQEEQGSGDAPQAPQDGRDTENVPEEHVEQQPGGEANVSREAPPVMSGVEKVVPVPDEKKEPGSGPVVEQHLAPHFANPGLLPEDGESS